MITLLNFKLPLEYCYALQKQNGQEWNTELQTKVLSLSPHFAVIG